MELVEGQVMTNLTKTSMTASFVGEIQPLISEAKVKAIMRRIMDGLAYMHSSNIAHRDIKLENLIYNNMTDKVHIIDFGFAVDCKQKLKTFCGTPSYMAPELVLKRPEYSG